MAFTIILLLVLVALIAVFILKKDLILGKINGQEVAQEVTPAAKKDENSISIENLVHLNIGLRISELNNEQFKDLLIESETLIENLIEVVQLVNEEGKYSEHTPLINRMATTYLPRYIAAYVDLPTDKKLAQKVEFKKGLDSLRNSIQAARKTLENENNEEFIKQMGFVKAFFDGDFNGGKQ